MNPNCCLIHMIKFCPLALICLVSWSAVPVFAQPESVRVAPAKNPTAVTPTEQVEASVREFVDALNSDNPYFLSVTVVANVRNFGYFGGPEWAEAWKKKRGTLRLEVEKIDVSDLTTTTAKARVSYHWHNRLLRVSSPPITENVNLIFGTSAFDAKSRWRVAPPRTLEEAQKLDIRQPLANADDNTFVPDNSPVLNEAAARVADPRAIWVAESSQESLFDLEQLAISTLQFTQDYDERYALAPEFYKDALTPYAQKQDIWTIPATGEPYTFNGNLSGLSSADAQLPNKSRVVMFYEGQNQTPVFRYSGSAAIAFADGHVALVSSYDAKTLIWKP